jgi:hypothetical protein
MTLLCRLAAKEPHQSLERALAALQDVVCSHHETERCFLPARLLDGDPESFFRSVVEAVTPGVHNFRRVSPDRYWWSNGAVPEVLFDLNRQTKGGGSAWYIRSFLSNRADDVRRGSHDYDAFTPPHDPLTAADMRALLGTFHKRLAALESRCSSSRQ